MYKSDIVKYSGEGKPPHIVMLFNPENDTTTPPDLHMSTSFVNIIMKPERLQIDRAAEPV